MNYLFKNNVLIFILLLNLVSVKVFANRDSDLAHLDTASVSIYESAPKDTAAYYFTQDNFGIKADGTEDVSDVLQEAINTLKRKKNFGIIFIPEGEYLISKTIYVPTAIRLIGFGAHRPVIKLKANSEGFKDPVKEDKGEAAYMLWFTSGISKKGRIADAGASTFYSGLSNVDLAIGEGNPSAVALRTHFAQHSFIEHVNIHIGGGKAGLFEIGNEMHNVKFFGGDYGIYTTKASPGWPYMMVDTYFEGQRKAAIKSQEAGLTIVRMHVKNVPVAIDIDEEFWEKLYMEDCVLEGVNGVGINVGMSLTPETQINLKDVFCRDVPVLIAHKDESAKEVQVKDQLYCVRNYSYGLRMDSITAVAKEGEVRDIVSVDQIGDVLKTDIASLPATSHWVNIKSLGAKGDGQTDDTKALKAAIEKYPYLYFPEGRYLISETLQLKEKTELIGLHPFATQMILRDNTPMFGGFGGPVAMVKSSAGGDNIITGIGLDAGRRNTRAVALQWEAGAHSLVNDIKFIGGHGSLRSPMYPEERGVYNRGEESLWDRQYWSLWVTNNGGGVFKNIWSASTYAAAGVYIAQTKTPGKIYAMSIEHHVRNEIRFNKVQNWSVYALQTEEESRESTECQPVIIEQSSKLRFANLYMFRVIRVNKPYPNAILTMNVDDIQLLNLHNYAQTKYTSSQSLYDLNKGIYVLPWELALLKMNSTSGFNTGKKVRTSGAGNSAIFELARGFEMPEGLCSDSKGNVYFCESIKKRIYKWSVETGDISLLGDYPWQPLALACDEDDRLLVVFKYAPMEGYLVNGQAEQFPTPEDAHGTSFSGWGNSGFGSLVYSINPEDPDHSISILKKVDKGDLSSPIKQAFYPAHRWRDFHDYKKVVVNEWDSCWLAPDGKTIIPVVYDLARGTSLSKAIPGKPLFVSDEYNERSYQLDVDALGCVSSLRFFAPRGSFAIVPDNVNNVWIADGDLYRYDKNGRLLEQIVMPERVTGFSLGGDNKDLLLISTYNGIFLKR